MEPKGANTCVMLWHDQGKNYYCETHGAFYRSFQTKCAVATLLERIEKLEKEVRNVKNTK